MANHPNGRDLVDTETEDVDVLFYNDRLDREYLSVADYPARIDQAAMDHFYGISIGKSNKRTGNQLSGSGTVGAFDFGRATGGYYKAGLKELGSAESDLPSLIGAYDPKSLGELTFRLNELRYKLGKLQQRGAEAQITDLNGMLEAVLEKQITRSMHSSGENVARQSLEDPETVLDVMHQIFSDPSSTAYADQLIELIGGPTESGDILSILDSPEMVTPLWKHQQEAIANWVAHGCKGYVDMATATGKTVLGLAAIATLCGRLHPNDAANIDTSALPTMEGTKRVLIVAGQDLLLEQWRSEFDEHLNIPRDRTGAEEGLREITLDWGTLEFKTAQELLAADAVEGYDIVVLDEAHQYTRGSRSGRGWRTVLDELVSHADAILAMSGSVDQGWLGDEAVQNALTDKLSLCKRFTVPEARAAGVITDFAWTTVYADAQSSDAQEKLTTISGTLGEIYDDSTHKFDVATIDASLAVAIEEPFETLTDLRSFSQSKDGSALREKSSAFDQLATSAFSRRPTRWQLTPTPDVIAALVAAHAPEQKVIVLVQSYRQAETVGQAISEEIGAELVLVPEADADTQFETVQQFNKGTYQVIVGPGKVLGTGVDMPDADVAINLSKGGVNASLIQRIGRVLRNPSGGKKAHFYHVVPLPQTPAALISGEDGRRLIRRAAEFRALGARLRELPGFTAASDATASTVSDLETAGVDAMVADRRDIGDIVDDEVAHEYLQQLISAVSTWTSEESVFLSGWTNQTLDRTTHPMDESVDALKPDARGTPPGDLPFDPRRLDSPDSGGATTKRATKHGEDGAGSREGAADDGREEKDAPTEPAVKQQSGTEALTDVSGVHDADANVLRDAGYTRVLDLKKASQEELAAIEAIGKPLAARIKADVGGIEPPDPNESGSENDQYTEPAADTDTVAPGREQTTESAKVGATDASSGASHAVSETASEETQSRAGASDATQADQDHRGRGGPDSSPEATAIKQELERAFEHQWTESANYVDINHGGETILQYVHGESPNRSSVFNILFRSQAEKARAEALAEQQPNATSYDVFEGADENRGSVTIRQPVANDSAHAFSTDVDMTETILADVHEIELRDIESVNVDSPLFRNIVSSVKRLLL